MTNLNLSVLNGRNGFIIQGVSPDGNLGDSVSSAGDLNNDGLPDIIVGAPNVDISGTRNEGRVSVIFGSSSGFDSEFPVSSLDGSNGFGIDGVSIEQRLGISVSNAGDLNNDEIEDIVIGANGTNNNRGDSYVIFGDTSIGSGIDLLSVDGDNGFKIDGIAEGDFFGGAVTNIGDLNDDGFEDIAIGANGVDANGSENAGATYVIFGREEAFLDDLDLELLDGTSGFVISGDNSGDFSGVSVSGAGDFNGDGIDDLLVGANLADPGERDRAGITYVIFGQSGGFTAELDLSNLGSDGFTISGVADGDVSGSSVTAVGDVNGDGFADVGIGAPYADTDNPNAGQGYIVFGTDTGFTEGFFLLSSLDGSNGFTVDGINVDDRLGTSISAAGDVNNDGTDDFIISAIGTNEEAGTSYVIFGQDGEEPFDATLDLADLNINTGFAIDGIVETDRSGESVSDLGDVNNDGIDDLLIGAPQASPRIGDSRDAIRDSGEAYVVFGRVANLGDVDNDGAYTDTDAFLISRVAVGLDAEFAAYPGIDPVLVGDVNSDGFVSALDSAIVESTVNGGTSSFILADFDN